MTSDQITVLAAAGANFTLILLAWIQGNKRIDDLGNRTTRLEDKLDKINERLEGKLDKINETLTRINERLATLEERDRLSHPIIAGSQ